MISQKGITLIGAIFVLIIVSLLGTYLVNVYSVQQKISVLALQTARAYQAANAGLEWSIASVVTTSSCPSSTPTSFGYLTGFTVSISCNNLGSYDENANISQVFQLKSSSHFGSYGEENYVSRQLEVIIHAP